MIPNNATGGGGGKVDVTVTAPPSIETSLFLGGALTGAAVNTDFEGNLILLGGYTSNPYVTAAKTFNPYVIKITPDLQTEIIATLSIPRGNAACAVTDTGKIFVIGGNNTTNLTGTATGGTVLAVEVVDMNTGALTFADPLPVGNDNGFAMADGNGNILFFQGGGGTRVLG